MSSRQTIHYPETPEIVDAESSTNYETASLIKTGDNDFTLCGFNKSGKLRPIQGNCMLGRLKRHHQTNGTSPKLMVCVTMYNEDVFEFKQTMRGVLQNFEAMCQDPQIKMKKNDFVLVLICDGIAKIPQTMIDYLVELKALDLKVL